MSVLIDLIYGGSAVVAGVTEAAVREAIEKYGPEKEIEFPATSFRFPLIYALTGVPVRTLEDLSACVSGIKARLTNEDSLEAARSAGLATLMGAEIIEGIQQIDHPAPRTEDEEGGFLPDEQALALADSVLGGESPGMALIMGKARNPERLASVIREYRARNILIFLVGDVMDQLAQSGVATGGESGVIPLGHDAPALIYAVTVPVRAALLRGRCKPGNPAELLGYVKNRIPTFVNTFGDIDAVDISAAAGAMAFGSPVVVDIDLGACQLPGVLESVCDHSQTAPRSLALAKLLPSETPDEAGSQ